ncbi:MAG: hypothetical protein HOP17_06310 [Acidobacteria bacterium]|nr:hypothetical protein [Acidobacteriota bacterium]
MGSVRILTFFSILILAATIPTAAQRTRKPVPRPTPRPTPKTTTPPVNPVVAAAKQLVANQLANVNLFVDKMGPIATSIETIDKDAKAKRVKKEIIDSNEANKKKLIVAIRGMRESLVSLESDFRTKPQLTRYLVQIQGISDLSARSVDSAVAGNFLASKDPLRQVAQKLSDTMAVLPK